MQNVILIGSYFNKDISSLELAQMINPKEWGNLAENPVFSELDSQIIDWLKEYTPKTYEIACSTSGRKSHDQILINAIKAKVLFEQLDYVGLRSMQRSRFSNLFSPIFENTYKYLVKAYKKHDVKPELIEFERIRNCDNIAPDYLGDRYGYSDYSEKKITAILEKQPDSEYLQLCKQINDEAKLLTGLRHSIEEIDFEPKDRSDFQTCACCFRWVRLNPKDRTRIAYHGYTICRYSYNDIVNGSCLGADFPPFQISADGTIALLKLLRKQIIDNSAELTTLDHNSSDRTIQKLVRELEYRIKSSEANMVDAISRIKTTHPDRLNEAQAI